MAAYAAACGRVLRLGVGSVGTSPISYFANPNGKRVYIVDSLALVRKLEARGVESKQAQEIVEAVLNAGHHSLRLQHGIDEFRKTIDESRHDICKALSEMSAHSSHGIEMMRAQLKAWRHGVIMFCMGILTTTSAFGLAVVCGVEEKRRREGQQHVG